MAAEDEKKLKKKKKKTSDDADSGAAGESEGVQAKKKAKVAVSESEAEETPKKKKAKKDKAEAKDDKDDKDDKEEAADRPSYEELAARVTPIAKPLASKKLTKRIYKLVKKARKAKVLARGVKEVTKDLKKKKTGLCIFAGDVTPIDVICHLPIVCEDNNMSYCFVPSKEDLGSAAQTKRPTSAVLIKPKKSGDEVEGYAEVLEEIKSLLAGK